MKNQSLQKKNKIPKKVLESTTDTEKKKLFLLLFTQELIRHSLKEPYEPEKIPARGFVKKIPKPKESIKSLVRKELSREKFQEKGDLNKTIRETKKFRSKQRPTQVRNIGIPRLRIPKPRLPERFQYLKPMITEKRIDLGELNELVNNPNISEIETQGPNENIFVSGNLGKKQTEIILSNEEINEVINRFSKAAKIPMFEGVFRVVVGKLIFLAIISEETGSKFLIKKMIQNQPLR